MTVILIVPESKRVITFKSVSVGFLVVLSKFIMRQDMDLFDTL